MLNNSKSISFDFSKPRVKKNGKVLSKFDLCWELDNVVMYNHRLYVILCDVYTYDELKDILFHSLNFLIIFRNLKYETKQV